MHAEVSPEDEATAVMERPRAEACHPGTRLKKKFGIACKQNEPLGKNMHLLTSTSCSTGIGTVSVYLHISEANFDAIKLALKSFNYAWRTAQLQ